MPTVICRGQTHELLPEPYWHLAHPQQGFLLHNVPLAEGLCWAISTVNRMPGLEKAVSPYALRAMSDGKERAWEEIRAAEHPNRPGRKGAVFLFHDRDVAHKAVALWFPNEERHLLEARVVRGSTLHRADARWLDCDSDRWEDNARSYWAGAMTDDPIPEVLVDGAVYFPGWGSPPFGVDANLPS